MDSNVYGASNLQFLENKLPEDVEKLVETARGVIDNEVNTNRKNLSDENISVMKNLRSDLSDFSYKYFIYIDYPKFSITPNE